MTVPVAGETMAELPAVLDELAGAGYSDIWTSAVNGTPFVQPCQRVRDTVRFLRAAFAGERVTFHGDSFEIDGCRVYRSPPGIGSASAARQGAAWKGSAKYWVSCVTRSPANSMMLTE
jgi:alkanesulfonate monooxygenase SsuD/methylene tetrahydromethanopterin reductase-like flavin-dependent oxidoreductase (luciferase family)